MDVDAPAGRSMVTAACSPEAGQSVPLGKTGAAAIGWSELTNVLPDVSNALILAESWPAKAGNGMNHVPGPVSLPSKHCAPRQP